MIEKRPSENIACLHGARQPAHAEHDRIYRDASMSISDATRTRCLMRLGLDGIMILANAISTFTCRMLSPCLFAHLGRAGEISR